MDISTHLLSVTEGKTKKRFCLEANISLYALTQSRDANRRSPVKNKTRRDVRAQPTQCPFPFSFGLCSANIVRLLSCMLIPWPWPCADHSAKTWGGGVSPNTHDMLRCPSKTPRKDTPTDPERKAVCGFQQRWHSQVPAWSTITAATMEHNYSISAPSGSEVLMASSLARSRECTEKFSPCRFRSGAFDLKKMASGEK